MTLKFSSTLEVVEIHVHAKFHQAKLQRFMSYRVHKLFALCRSGEKSENVVL